MSPPYKMAFIDRRKRSREDDVPCDSVPLSKRINNLHLTNFEEATPHHNNLTTMDDSLAYSPELTEAENPFYYLKNKLLHDLWVERLKRCPV